MSQPKVFISYTRDDAEWVRKFAEALRAERVDVWLDQWQIPPGESFRDALETGLRESDAIVSVVSATNARLPNTLFEVGAALGMGKRLIPIVPSGLNTAVMPYELRNRRFVTKAEPVEVAREVADALKREAA